MPYTLIKGSFHIHYPDNPLGGPEPDGDTVKFRPDTRALIEGLPRPNRPAGFNRAGMTNLRFEAIDALETHFQVEGDEFHQNLTLALGARDALLAQMGFGAVRFFEQSPFRVESVETHPIRGYVLSNGLDTYGRTIAFVYLGEHPAEDGARVFVTPQMLDESLNTFMLSEGHAYAAFYLTLPAELRIYLHRFVSAARGARTGLWAQASATTEVPAEITGLDTLQDLVIWPKLFRRLATYFQEGNEGLAGFDAWLRQDTRNRDDRLLLPSLELGNLHDLFLAAGDRLRLAYRSEDVVVVPDDYSLPAAPTATTPASRVGSGAVRIVAALVNPPGPERGNETVTLLNTLNDEIALSGWFIADSQGRQALQGMLAPGESRRIPLGNAVQLSNVRDTLTLLDAQGFVVDQASYEARDLPGEGLTMVF